MRDAEILAGVGGSAEMMLLKNREYLSASFVFDALRNYHLKFLNKLFLRIY